MNRPKTQTDELIPLAERLTVLWWFRVAAVALIAVVWWLVPASRGTTLSALSAGTGAYLLAAALLHGWWRRTRRRSHGLFSIVLILDSAYLAWVTYATAGFGTPTRELVLAYLIAVSLLASYRTGMKLALWSSLLVLAVFHAGELHIDPIGLHGDVRFGDATYRDVAVQIGLFWLVAVTTGSFAAINERELRRRRYDLESLADLSYALDGTAPPDHVARVLVDQIREAFGYDDIAVVAAAEGAPRLLASGAQGRVVSTELDAPWVRQVSGEDRRRLAIDVGDDPLLLSVMHDTRNVMLLPLRAAGRTSGVVAIGHALRRDSRVERRVVAILERYAAHAALALENAWLLERARHQASNDVLTGLANRRSLEEELGRMTAAATRSGDALTALLIDIDHFKAINDRFGHAVGDDVLRTVGQTLGAEVRAMDLAARYGGEEFCVLLPGLEGRQAWVAADRLRAALQRASTSVPFTASIGAATLRGDRSPLPSLLEAADAALYEAKRNGRNRVELDPSVLAAPAGEDRADRPEDRC